MLVFMLPRLHRDDLVVTLDLYLVDTLSSSHVTPVATRKDLPVVWRTILHRFYGGGRINRRFSSPKARRCM